MGQPPKPPKFKDVVWTAPHAMGLLLANGYLCCERGAWNGFPYLMTNRPLREASRKWFNDHTKRIKREHVGFWDGTAGIWQPPGQPQPLTQTAPPEQGREQQEGTTVSRSSPTPPHRTPRRRQRAVLLAPGRS